MKLEEVKTVDDLFEIPSHIMEILDKESLELFHKISDKANEIIRSTELPERVVEELITWFHSSLGTCLAYEMQLKWEKKRTEE